MKFADALSNQEARTLNDMKAINSTSNANVDLFFKIGASRGKNIIPSFVSAYVENRDYALRIAQWVRDIRQGAGERQLFKDILIYLDSTDEVAAKMLIDKTAAKLGRWDDLLIDYKNKNVEDYAFNLIKRALKNENGLCAKWCPRKGPFSIKLRNFLNMTPKQYRKTLVNLTKVVESQMCKKEWKDINFSNVPSLASARYKTAFYRNAESKFTEYVDKLTKGDKSVKVNVGAVYPYDVINEYINSRYSNNLNQTKKDHMIAQWNALPNFVDDANIFPMVDTSGSMGCAAGRNENLSCMSVAISLGLYLADKNTGIFKDAFLTFSSDPEIMKLQGNIIQKIDQMLRSNWSMSTNLHKAFDKMLQMAFQNKITNDDMPKILLILSDMQFDRCVKFDDAALEMINRKYREIGYEMPKIVFWNINSYDSVPVKFDTSGTALVSGFSPSIMKAVLNADFEQFTPEAIMKKTIMDERYNY